MPQRSARPPAASLVKAFRSCYTDRAVNQDQLKALLLRLEPAAEEFTVIFSGKKSRKVDGLYRPDTREIIIHNRNLEHPRELVYTGIHELAHHIQFTAASLPVSGRAHTTAFWSIFHTLLARAEQQGSYESIFASDPEFTALTAAIKTEILAVGGDLVRKLGSRLLEAQALCRRHHVSFEDYLERVLGLPRSEAALSLKAGAYDLDPALGAENMKLLTRIREPEAREQAGAELLAGRLSPAQVRGRYLAERREEAEPLELLEQERSRLEAQIRRLKQRLAEIESRIAASHE
jgi:hypothetical protein